MAFPVDCLYLIFERLDSISDRESFGLTCHSWLDVQNSSLRSLKLTCYVPIPIKSSESRNNSTSLSRNNRTSLETKLNRLLLRFRNLKSFTITGWSQLSDSGLSVLALCSSTLQALHLCYCTEITDLGMPFIASVFPSLSSITLSSSHVTDIGLNILTRRCTGLKDINLSGCIEITDRGISYLIMNCRQLQSLRISHCGNIRGLGFKDCSKTLTCLVAQCCKLFPEGIKGILSGGGMQFLNLSFCTGMNGDGVTFIGGGISSRLRVLDLRRCRTVRDETIAVIANECSFLQHWHLGFCLQIGLSSWESIGLNCQSLERLHVNRCTSLCVVGMQALRDGCKRLSILYTGTPNSRLSLLAREVFQSLRPEVELRNGYVESIIPKEAFFELQK
ncbi:F-box/LRR-repeat protein 12-like [Impatiens glandulifera]|uniref:F-box/LRR-repeat protein 12-like n=1 Tax=Impatiens glandulifera TaxID=253017 RepID=UPI001FB0A187|nr:F-box/LRR-repeat protein 12-like [Impatiens glandulifera]